MQKLNLYHQNHLKLIGLTRHLNILGGDNANIGFKATGEIPDSIFIEFRPVF